MRWIRHLAKRTTNPVRGCADSAPTAHRILSEVVRSFIVPKLSGSRKRENAILSFAHVVPTQQYTVRRVWGGLEAGNERGSDRRPRAAVKAGVAVIGRASLGHGR